MGEQSVPGCVGDCFDAKACLQHRSCPSTCVKDSSRRQSCLTHCFSRLKPCPRMDTRAAGAARALGGMPAAAAASRARSPAACFVSCQELLACARSPSCAQSGSTTWRASRLVSFSVSTDRNSANNLSLQVFSRVPSALLNLSLSDATRARTSQSSQSLFHSKREAPGVRVARGSEE